jgi:hypothetical protein
MKTVKPHRRASNADHYNHWLNDIAVAYKKHENAFYMKNKTGLILSFPKPEGQHPHPRSIDKAYPQFYEWCLEMQPKKEEEE